MQSDRTSVTCNNFMLLSGSHSPTLAFIAPHRAELKPQKKASLVLSALTSKTTRQSKNRSIMTSIEGDFIRP
ncbi:hypothetical protein AV903_11150 [Erwinia tracheiphila]|uniref:Uncharacterized protein n=1 Tax=Erwinia tracheiphila TaxID=65700 RepID=A0A345CSQ5_9GAMM|nr:hypothetical protein AV903_11150 [Erwinia tracheiphila]